MQNGNENPKKAFSIIDSDVHNGSLEILLSSLFWVLTQEMGKFKNDWHHLLK